MGFGKKLAAGAAIGVAGFAAGVASSTFVRKLYSDLLDHLEAKIDGDLKLFDLDAEGGEDFVDQIVAEHYEEAEVQEPKAAPKPDVFSTGAPQQAFDPSSICNTTNPSCYGSAQCGVSCDCAHRRYRAVDTRPAQNTVRNSGDYTANTKTGK